MTQSLLALSDAQLDEIKAAARQVPPNWRARFLEAVADQLMLSNITDADVATAIDTVLQKITGGDDAA